MIGFELVLLFFIIALLYASVGFGGGSTYIALMALTGLSFTLIPIIALCCNIIVVSGGSIRFFKAKIIPWSRIWLILVFSVPAAWLGGLTPISQNIFISILGVLLVIAGLLIIARSFLEKTQIEINYNGDGIASSILLGGGIGYMSGLIGIGGGIFLAPLLLLFRWGKAREVAATASIFILFNSIAGLIGQIWKYEEILSQDFLTSYGPLLLAVLIGGQIGSHLAVKILPERLIQIFTAILTLYVGGRLLWPLLNF